jgi:hypothetical protein
MNWTDTEIEELREITALPNLYEDKLQERDTAWEAYSEAIKNVGPACGKVCKSYDTFIWGFMVVTSRAFTFGSDVAQYLDFLSDLP